MEEGRVERDSRKEIGGDRERGREGEREGDKGRVRLSLYVLLLVMFPVAVLIRYRPLLVVLRLCFEGAALSP